MTVVKAKPTSPGRRFRSLQIDRDIHKGRPLSSLTVKKIKLAEEIMPEELLLDILEEDTNNTIG